MRAADFQGRTTVRIERDYHANAREFLYFRAEVDVSIGNGDCLKVSEHWR